MNQMKEVHILNHTHWDREWYETFEEFRYKLRNGLRYVQDLLEKGDLDNFFLDGQTIVLDDYQEIVSPPEYERLLSFIQQGKIEVGPWYLLADEFLVSGESILKNLEIGTTKAKSLGSSHPVGYMPDTFGHISQMPQILKGYQIDSALIFRGAVSDRFENNWVGADGSKVFTFVLPLFEGYYQTFLKHDTFIDETKKYLEGNAPYLSFGKALIMNGADHTFTSSDLKERLEQLKGEFPGVEFKQSLMSDYVRAFQGDEPEGYVTGEQRDPSKVFILPGVYSTRTYLKDQNQLCEDQAIGVMEALNVWTNGKTDSAEFIDYVWKLILQNQPHDSICGCSVDEVHNEMETRSQKVLSAIRQFSSDTLNSLFPFEFLNSAVENPYLYLVNNTPIVAVFPVSATIRIPVEQDLGAIKLFYYGIEIQFDVLKREKREEFLRHILAEPHYAEYVVYDVSFTMPFEGAAIKTIRIERVNVETDTVKNLEASFIKNDFYHIQWNNSSLQITDLMKDKIYENQHQFISSLDAGDSYNYSPPIDDMISKACITSVSDLIKGETFQSVTLHYEMKLPASLNDVRTGPSNQYVVNKFTTKVTLYRGNRLIYFKTKVKNVAKDQKLRVGFAVSEADHSYSDTAFDLVKREILREKQWDMPKNKEAVMNQYPTYSSVMVNDHQLVHRGLQEYEVDHFEAEDTAFLTMIRGVGWLSRRDLRTRGNGAGPGFETPGAQCLGTYEFEYGLVLGEEYHSLNHKGLLRQSTLSQQSYQFKSEQKLFVQSSPVVTFSSFMMKAEDTFDIRLFNPSTEEQTTELSFGFDPDELSEVDFTGDVMDVFRALPKITIVLRPKEIKTIRVKKNSQP
ncbi:glycoside hydrolase family 38 C-terminal domain-containing protein [Neobacillus sp. WH10]|uniref:glycoside hydrolase family 38 N-terminal domain-containing protein n=1 Tax=Neobacillus sp. WH10 TaxID=3047873 RepID=UPI0024C19A34|nr:glycoside hydrolase family 38 C-terminal domain-containing protein [Neobacillus sp. WH10]WHY77820.1 glycoside hydrolase family 38 C-terminal domain-containing protein [Neobacillus sp. WH10]